jgi:cobyrinic acid a,c-diamide synthase
MASDPRGFIIAAPRSGAGKTTVTLGLMRAFRQAGRVVQPYKCGPDYIDPAFHAAATGRASYNLDLWAMGADRVRGLVTGTGAGADLVIVEGVMGLFDGAAADGPFGRGATADVAATLGLPVVLVLDVSGQTETAAAVANGLAGWRDDVTIAGVILNRVASERHEALVRAGFERGRVPVLGVLRRRDELTLPERHLGLVQAAEMDDLDARLDRFADAVSGGIDLSAVAAVARPPNLAARQIRGRGLIAPPGQRIALARDAAFSFCYPHLVRDWRAAGAELIPFSPLANEAPDPAADAVWLPGGYPELHAGVLAHAECFQKGMAAAVARGAAVHGECGGYMVLGAGLVDAEGIRHPMLGLLGLETSFAARRLHLGYRMARLLADGALGPAGRELVGHEFHYASVVASPDNPLAAVADAAGCPVSEAGSRRGRVTGTFFHVLAGRPD